MSPAHRPSRLFFITGNANKLAEVRAILADTGVELSSKALDLPELQGGIEEISRDKCRRAAEAVSNSLVCAGSVRVLCDCCESVVKERQVNVCEPVGNMCYVISL